LSSCRRAPLRVVALSLFVLGCRGEPTAPRPSLTVGISFAAPPTEVLDELSGSLKLTCSADLSATATGTGTAHWQDGMLRFYYGWDRTVAADSQPVSQADVRSAWGDTIAVGSHLTSRWQFWASGPFEVEAEFRYLTDGGATKPAKARIACGPVPQGLQLGGPTVTQLSVTPPAELEPGQFFDVTYSVTSPTALWSTSVLVEGPFTSRQETAEHLATATTRTVRVTVPGGAEAGYPIVVRVVATDIALRTNTRTVATTSLVVDRTPPAILHTEITGAPTRLAGQFGVGDQLSLYVEARDNALLKWIVWELGAPANARDSVLVSPSVNYKVVSIPITVRPEWVGAPTLSVYARDAWGLKSEVISSATDSLRFYPVVTRTASAPVTASSPSSPVLELGDVVFDAKRGVYYVALRRSKDVGVLDATTMIYRTPITLPAEVAGLDLTAGGDSLVVALPSLKSLGIVNLASPAPPTIVALTVLDTAGTINSFVTPRPTQVRVAANGKAIVGLDHWTAGGDDMVEVDLGTGAQRIRADARGASPYVRLLAGPTPDRSRILMPDYGCLRSYVSATDAFTSCGATKTDYPWSLTNVTFDAAGRLFTLGNGVFDPAYTTLRMAAAINFRMPIGALSPDGAFVYLGADQTVAKMRVADGAIVERFAVPVTVQRMMVSPTGDWLYVFQNDYAVRAARVDLR
jgi:hypothetical protein